MSCIFDDKYGYQLKRAPVLLHFIHCSHTLLIMLGVGMGMVDWGINKNKKLDHTVTGVPGWLQRLWAHTAARGMMETLGLTNKGGGNFEAKENPKMEIMIQG